MTGQPSRLGDIYYCELCDDLARTPTTKLCGGFYIQLCNRHKNAWHGYIMEKDIWKDYRQAAAVLKFVENGGTSELDKILIAEKSYHNVANQVWHIAKKWAKDNNEKGGKDET